MMYPHNLNRSIPPFLLIILVLLFVRCTAAEKENQSNKSLTVSKPALVITDKYKVNTNESTLTWSGSMLVDLTAGHTGYVDIISGELLVTENGLTGGTFQFDMTTITDKEYGSDNEFIRHLKSEDFFEVDKFPLASFGIISVTPADGETVMIKGSLTLKGISQTISFPASVDIKEGIINAEGEVIIDRTRWDIVYKSGSFLDPLADEMISDDIKLIIRIVAEK